MTAMFSLNYVPNGMFNLFLGQLREHSHVLINPLRDDVYYDFYRIRPEIEEDYWACRAGRVNFDCYMCPYCRGGWCQESCKESKEAKAARYDTKDVITFMHAAFLSALCDLAFSGREYDMVPLGRLDTAARFTGAGRLSRMITACQSHAPRTE